MLFAEPKASEEEIIEALRAANIWDFVEKEEKKLDT